MTFIQQLINGLMLGGSYALVAIGYTLLFGVLNLLHLAHGKGAMIGSYIGLTLPGDPHKVARSPSGPDACPPCRSVWALALAVEYPPAALPSF